MPEAPTDEDVMNYLNNGWGGLEHQDENAEAQREERAEEDYRINKAIHSTFGSGDGALVLEWLRDATIEQPTFNPQLGIIAVLQGCSREGQNSIYREIVRRMKLAEMGPPSAKTTEG